MSDRMAKVGEFLRLAGAGTLLAVQPWQRRVYNHLMLVEEMRNKAKVIGMDPAIMDAIVDGVRVGGPPARRRRCRLDRPRAGRATLDLNHTAWTSTSPCGIVPN